jgi:hypothetical protein
MKEQLLTVLAYGLLAFSVAVMVGGSIAVAVVLI